MALEVNEIGIRMRVSEDGDDDDGGGRGKRAIEQEGDGGYCGKDRGEIVDDCVRRVLQVLKTMRER